MHKNEFYTLDTNRISREVAAIAKKIGSSIKTN
jgi:hypothetical protein